MTKKFVKLNCTILLLLVVLSIIFLSSRYVRTSEYIFHVNFTGEKFTVANGINMLDKEIVIQNNTIYIDDYEVKFEELLKRQNNEIGIKFSLPDGSTFLYEGDTLNNVKLKTSFVLNSTTFANSDNSSRSELTEYKRVLMSSISAYFKYKVFLNNLIVLGILSLILLFGTVCLSAISHGKATIQSREKI